MNGAIRSSRRLAVVPSVFVAVALLAALAFGGFGAVAPASAQGSTVTIVDFAFNPDFLQVTAGTTVTWVNNGAVAHTATGNGFDTGNIAPGGSASFTFNTPGTYDYICSIHPNQMAGTIVVTSGQAAPTATTAPAGPTATTAPTTGLPSTGTGAAGGSDAILPAVAGLLAVVAACGVAGLALRRRPVR